MKELLVAYASYNRWAHQTITAAILELDESLYHKEVKSSFPSLYATVMHVWDAESIWWQRMEGHSNILIPTKQFQPTMHEAVNGLLQQAGEWERFVSQADDENLQTEFEYKNLKGQPFRSGVWQVVHHLFNHGTYHRGQLVTMMRELGAASIPATDFIHWYRTYGK
jgi:uncharacterized damage-inducible protein DinB